MSFRAASHAFDAFTFKKADEPAEMTEMEYAAFRVAAYHRQNGRQFWHALSAPVRHLIWPASRVQTGSASTVAVTDPSAAVDEEASLTAAPRLIAV